MCLMKQTLVGWIAAKFGNSVLASIRNVVWQTSYKIGLLFMPTARTRNAN